MNKVVKWLVIVLMLDIPISLIISYFLERPISIIVSAICGFCVGIFAKKIVLGE